MLNTYITQVQRLLADPNGSYWPTSELTDYINEARNRVAQDTRCLRQLVTSLALPAQQETYIPQTFIGALGSQLVDTIGITIYWGNERRKLGYLAFTKFDALYRRYQLFFGQPECFTKQGANVIFVAPVPDQNYVSDWDVAVVPNALVNDSTIEQIPVPFQEPVQYYAAYKAKFKEQAQGEAQLFLRQYLQILQWCARSFNTYRVPSAYMIGR